MEGGSIVIAGSEGSQPFQLEKRPQLNDFIEQASWNSVCVVCVRAQVNVLHVSVCVCVSLCGATFRNVGLRRVCNSLCAYTCSLLWYWGTTKYLKCCHGAVISEQG